MKAQMKAVMASAVVIVLALAAVSGVTYSWWSDSESTDISITTGFLDVDVSGFYIKNVNTSLMDSDELPDSFSIKYDGDRDAVTKWDSNSSILTISGNPGKIDIELGYTVKFTSNVDYKFLIDVNMPSIIKESDISIQSLSQNSGAPESVTIGSWTSLSDTTNFTSLDATYHVTISIKSLSIGETNSIMRITNMITQYHNDNSIWNGNIPDSLESSGLTIEPSGGNNTGTITIHSAGGLVYLNELAKNWVGEYSNGQGTEVDNYRVKNGGSGTDYYYYWSWNILLDKDLDMNNIKMSPINIDFWDTFDGCGHTISNVVLQEGGGSLFHNGVNLIKNLNVKNIVISAPKVEKVGAIANNATCENVHVRDAQILGGKYVGGLVGKGSSFNNCSITDSIIIGKSKTVGGLVGYAVGDPDTATISGNVVDNVVVTGAYNVGGLLGHAQNAVVQSNIVRNVTIDSTEELPSNASPEERNTGTLVARIYGKTTINSNTVDNVVVTAVSTSNELNEAINDNATHIILTDGNFEANLYDVAKRDKLTIAGQGDGTTLKFSNLQVRASQFNELTIENCIIERMPNKGWGHLVFGSSEEAGGIYTISNCIFNGVGTQGIYINQNVPAMFNIDNCTFNGDFGKEGAITVQNNDDVKVTVNVVGCEFKNVPETSHEIYVLYAYNGWTLNAEGIKVYWAEKP